MLKRLGYTVTPFTNSRDALKAFINDSAKFDVVITDLEMPKMAGITRLHTECLCALTLSITEFVLDLISNYVKMSC